MTRAFIRIFIYAISSVILAVIIYFALGLIVSVGELALTTLVYFLEKLHTLIFGKEESVTTSSGEIWEQSILEYGEIIVHRFWHFLPTSKFTLFVKQKGRSYAMLYSRKYHYLQQSRFRIRAQVTPLTLYRFALGIWTSNNPNNALTRLAILEVDDDVFRLTYTGYPQQQHLNFNISPRVKETYTIELELQEFPYVARGRIYEGNNLLEEVTAKNLALPYRSNDIFAGVAVWTDDTLCPLSRYEVKNLEVG